MTPNELAEKISILLNMSGPTNIAHVIDEPNVVCVEIDDTTMFVTVENV